MKMEIPDLVASQIDGMTGISDEVADERPNMCYIFFLQKMRISFWSFLQFK